MKKTLALIALVALALCVITVGNAVADQAKNEAIIERNLEEIWNNLNLGVIDEIVSTNYVRHMPDGSDVRGRDGYRGHVLSYRNPLPDMDINMDIPSVPI